MAFLSGPMVKVYLYILMRTTGFYKRRDNIALSQFEHGIVDSEGNRLDYGTGMSRNAIIQALKGLKRLGLIGMVNRTSGSYRTNTYWLNP